MAKTQWHSAFCAAMRLELKDSPTLEFTNEFNLTEKPLEVDMKFIDALLWCMDTEMIMQSGTFMIKFVGL